MQGFWKNFGGQTWRVMGHVQMADEQEKSRFVLFATSTFPIIHLICPPKFCISTVFNFSWNGCNTQEKRKTKVMQNVFGANRVHYGKCGSGVYYIFLKKLVCLRLRPFFMRFFPKRGQLGPYYTT